MNAIAEPIALDSSGRVELGKYCQLALERVLKETDGLSGGVIASSDGFEIAAAGIESELRGRLAAIIASLFALGLTAATEAQLGLCHSSVIECEAGKFVVRALHYRDRTLLVGLLAKADAPMGAVVYTSRKLSEVLARVVV
jgi:predicted regulator of Ras-like GTPase activity (Roadblock/LC7/MglB family)